MIEPTVMYDSIRKEIVEQKKCQFQLFGLSLTLTASVLAYAAASKVGPLVYIAPLLMNLLSMIMILDKAVSIQRMVGYLQLMENDAERRQWKWEYHLNKFRELQGEACGSEPYRKHDYVRSVALMLLILNVIASLLYAWGPDAVALRKSPDYQSVREFYGAVNLIVGFLNAYGIFVAVRRWSELVNGRFTSCSIRRRWEHVLEDDATHQPPTTPPSVPTGGAPQGG